MSVGTYWQEMNRVSVLKKLRKTLTLEPFCLRCGIDQSSMFFTSRETTSPTFTAYTTSAQSLKSAFTIEFWFKTSNPHSTYGTIFGNYRNTGGSFNISVGLLNTKIVVRVVKGGTTHTLTSTSMYAFGAWSHVAVVYDGSSVRIVEDGVQDVSELVLAADLDADAGDLYATFLGGKNDNTEFFVGHLNEVRIWNVGLTNSQIAANKDAPKGKMAGLVRYYRLNESGTTISDYLDDTLTFTITNTTVIPDSETYYPRKYGASWIVGKYTIVTTSKCSIRFPARVPTDANFMLCVSWLENEDDTHLSRRKLWDMDGVDIAPIPDRYRGEKLPITFYLEVWNIDGNANVELLEDYILEVSDVTLPTNQTDSSQQVFDDNPTIETALAESFALGPFALEFSEEQFGSCADPLDQDLDSMSNNLTVNGGTVEISEALILSGGEGGYIRLAGGGKILTSK